MKLKATFTGSPSLGYEPHRDYDLIAADIQGVSISRPDGTGTCEYQSLSAFFRNWTNVRVLSLFILFLTCSISSAQETSKQYLIDQVKNNLQYNELEKAFINLVPLQQNYPQDDYTRFLTAAVTYYTAVKDVKFKDFKTLRAVSEYLGKEDLYFKDKERGTKITAMKTILDFSFIYYPQFKENLSPTEVKALENRLKNDALFLKDQSTGLEEEINRVLQFINV